MNIIRNEIRTGLLVVLSLATLAAVLIYLGAPGVFTKQKTLGIYFDNAAGIKLGTPVMLAGRKIGQVVEIHSPIAPGRRPVGPDGKPLPLEVLVDVRVDRSARIYYVTKVRLTSYTFVGEPVIDFTGGDETSGVAEEWSYFVGERPGGLADTGTQIIEKLDPAVTKLSSALESLEKTANNLTRLTGDGADLPAAFGEVRKVATNLADLTGPQGSLRKSLDSLDALARNDGEIAKTLQDFRKLIAPESDLTKALANVEKFTRDLSGNTDVPATLKNFRAASEKLNVTIGSLRSQFSEIAANLEHATDTVKREPWRLVWPSTKKYAEPTPAPKKKR